ncbi:MAG: outer membrane protein transport protein [Polyangiaceae bacterium]|nr:outer membrane protein transport protein [Polyangiaceae bacterium]
MGAKRIVIGAAVASLGLGFANSAFASSGLDSPDSGVIQVGRGATYVARADDPLATVFNPAGLAHQKSGVFIGAHLMFSNRCFSRRNPDGSPVSPGASLPGPGAPGGPEDPVCADMTPFPNPQIAANFRISDRFAVGIAVLGPHGVGNVSWPESVSYTNQLGLSTTQPAPNRFMLVEQESLLINPTVSVSYAIKDWLSIGAGFIWGVASVKFVNFSESTSQVANDDFAGNQEVRASLSAVDGFIPGFVVGVLASPHKRLDLGAQVRWQDAVSARSTVQLESLYWKSGGTKNDAPCAGVAADCNITNRDDAGSVKLNVPFTARFGFRYHSPQKQGSLVPKVGRKVRDTLVDDRFDVELDFTYAHNSVVDNMEVRFEPGIRVNGTPGYVPENADIPHKWKNVFGARLGGDYVFIPGFLAARAGAWFETNGQDPEYLNTDFHLGYRVGVNAGATVRLGRFDVSLAYQHTFFETFDNGGNGKLKGLSGDATTGYRTVHNINGGKLTSSLDEVALGATFRF